MYLTIQSFIVHKRELLWTVNKWQPQVICLNETYLMFDIEFNQININCYIYIDCKSLYIYFKDISY